MLRDIVRDLRRECCSRTTACRHGRARTDVNHCVINCWHWCIVRYLLRQVISDGRRKALRRSRHCWTRHCGCGDSTGACKSSQNGDIISPDGCQCSCGIGDTVDRRQQSAVADEEDRCHTLGKSFARGNTGLERSSARLTLSIECAVRLLLSDHFSTICLSACDLIFGSVASRVRLSTDGHSRGDRDRGA